jgi:integrase
MPRRCAVPSYCLHKPSNRAYAYVRRRRVYLGPYGSDASKAEYRRLIAELESKASPHSPLRQRTRRSDLTVNELALDYIDHADAFYRKPNGDPTTERGLVKIAVGMAASLYGHTLVAEFGPIALKTIRNAMVAKGWARLTVNRHVGRIVRMFKWAAENELVDGAALHALRSLTGLRFGRTTAPESKPVRPVDASTIDATLPHLPPPVAAMVRLQRLTGMRPGEVCQMRPCDIDATEDVWIYRPTDHKTLHHGRERSIYIGPKGQMLLKPFLHGRPAQMPLFSPIEAMHAVRSARAAARRTPMKAGNSVGSNRQPAPRKQPGAAYTTASYGRSIKAACEKEWPTKGCALAAEELAKNRRRHWHPNQLRHTAATEHRRQFGLEAAQILLGHAKADVTQIYAERDASKAVEIARQVG